MNDDKDTNSDKIIYSIFYMFLPLRLFLFSIKHLVLTNFLETYPHIMYLDYINGMMNSSIGISSIIVYIIFQKGKYFLLFFYSNFDFNHLFFYFYNFRRRKSKILITLKWEILKIKNGF